MKASRQQQQKEHHQLQNRGCKALCCSCRFSVSSSEEADSSISERYPSISSLAHAMVQERLDQMIRERLEARHIERRRQHVSREGTKFVVMVAMEKSSYDPREDFRESIVEMIMANRLQDPKDLRSLLNYYVSMNSQEYHSLILEVFHEGWAHFNPSKDYNHWAERNRFQISDTLIFKYQKGSGLVLEVNKDDYNSRRKPSPSIPTPLKAIALNQP